MKNFTQGGHTTITTKDPKGFIAEKAEERASCGIKLFEAYLADKDTREIVEDLEPAFSDPKKQKRALETMIMVHNQWQFFKNAMRAGVSEATISANFGNTPRNIVKMIRYTSANSIINDILDVQTMAQMTGMAYYILPVATKTKKEGDVSAGDTIHDNLSRFFATETAFLTLTEGGGTYTGTSTYVSPLRKGTIKLVAIGTGGNVGLRRELAFDDGNGNFTPADGVNTAQTITAGAIDYTARDFTAIQFDGGVALTNFNVRAEFNWDSERDVTEHAEVELILKNTPLTAYMHPVGFNFSATAQLLVDSTLGERIDTLLDNTSMNQLKIEKDRIGLETLYRLGCMTDEHIFDTENPNAHSPKEHAQALLVAVKELGASMHIGNERGGVSYLVAGAGAEAYLNHLDKYVVDNSMPRKGAYKAGTLAGMPVFVSNVIPSNTLLAGWHGTDDGDSPLIYAPFLDAGTPELTTKDFITQKGVASWYDIVPIIDAQKYVRRLKLDNLSTLPTGPANP